MLNFFELQDIVLLPSVVNQGHPGGKVNFEVRDLGDLTGIPNSLPIFASPMESIVSSGNVKTFVNNGIKPVLPGTESLDIRLQYCSWIYCAFSLNEVEECFLKSKRPSDRQFHICIDAGNGHDVGLLNMGLELRKMYANQVCLMGGNVGIPEVYKDYSNAGFDYMRVGLSSSSVVDKDKYGFHYPMASLLDDIKTYRFSGAGKGLRPVKVIADGGINSFSSIVKAIACGADYVMLGREFARTIEAAGGIFKKQKTKDGGKEFVQINSGSVQGWEGGRAKVEGLQRWYYGNTTNEIRTKRKSQEDQEAYENGFAGYVISDSAGTKDWIYIDYSLDEWVDDFKECAYYAFMMTNSLTWEEFKKNARYGTH